MPPAAPALLQVAVEYGAASASAGAGVSGSTLPIGGPLAHLQSVASSPPGLIGAGVVIVWLLARRQNGTGSAVRGLLGNLLLGAIGLAATYAILRWRGAL